MLSANVYGQAVEPLVIIKSLDIIVYMEKQFNLKQKVFTLTLFSIAMGLLEAVVVVYLRLVFYQHGFSFPLVMLPNQVYRAELLREAATLIMLGCVSVLAGKRFNERLAYFLLTFAVWDIFYYVSLKALLDWPATILDWDILFLIPVTWIGPVLAPVICSFTMLLMAGLVLYFIQSDKRADFSALEWFSILTGSFVILYTFIRDYAAMIISNISWEGHFRLVINEHIQEDMLQFTPTQYSWDWFAVGLGLILLAVGFWFRRMKQLPD